MRDCEAWGLRALLCRNHAPNVAISIVVVAGIGFCFLTSLVDLGSIVALQSLFFAPILLAGGVAATILPLRRADPLETPRPGCTRPT